MREKKGDKEGGRKRRGGERKEGKLVSCHIFVITYRSWLIENESLSDTRT